MTVTSSLPLTTGTWSADTAHSSVEFTVRHLGLTKVRGRFNSFDATLTVGQDLAGSVLSARVDLASVDTNNTDRDDHLRGTDFFDVDAHPTMTFASTGITADGDDYVVDGTLTLNGVTNPVRLEVEFNGTEVYPMDEAVHAGFSASTRISRKDYGVEFDVPVGVDKMAIGDKVTVELEVQFVEPS
jgi:polyisoprenoid-binding protein YceI